MKKLNLKTYFMLIAFLFGLVTQTNSIVSATTQDTTPPKIISATYNKTEFVPGESGTITVILEDENKIERIAVVLENEGPGHSSGVASEIKSKRYINSNGQIVATLEFTIPTPIPDTTFKALVLSAEDNWGNSTSLVSSFDQHPLFDQTLKIINKTIETTVTINPSTASVTTTPTTTVETTTTVTKPSTTTPVSTETGTPTTVNPVESISNTTTVQTTNQPITTETPTVSIPATTQATTTIKPETTTQTVPITTKSSEPVITKVTPVTTQTPVPTTTAPKPVTTPSTEATTKTITVKQPFTTNGRASVVYYVIDKYRKPSDVYWYFEENLRRFMDTNSGSTVHTMTEAQAIALGKRHSRKEKEVLTAEQIILLQNNLNANPIQQAINPITLPSTSNTQQQTKVVPKTLPKTGQKHTEAYVAIGILSIILATLTFYKKHN